MTGPHCEPHVVIFAGHLERNQSIVATRVGSTDIRADVRLFAEVFFPANPGWARGRDVGQCVVESGDGDGRAYRALRAFRSRVDHARHCDIYADSVVGKPSDIRLMQLQQFSQALRPDWTNEGALGVSVVAARTSWQSPST